MLHIYKLFNVIDISYYTCYGYTLLYICYGYDCINNQCVVFNVILLINTISQSYSLLVLNQSSTIRLVNGVI